MLLDNNTASFVSQTVSPQSKSAVPTERADHSALRKTEMFVFAFCDFCEEQAEGRRSNLEQNGWELQPTAQYCPFHNQII